MSPPAASASLCSPTWRSRSRRQLTYSRPGGRECRVVLALHLVFNAAQPTLPIFSHLDLMKAPIGRLVLVPVVAAVLSSSLARPHAQGSGAASQPKFTVPAGFEVVRVAGPPLVDRPIVADFDEQGRLYVA